MLLYIKSINEYLYGNYFLRLQSGAYSGICPGGFNLFSLPRGTQHPLGPKNPLKTIDLTDP